VRGEEDDVVNAGAERRIHVLAGSLYYCGQLNHGYTTEQVFEALPPVDQLFFESLARGALEAAAHWRTHKDRVPPPPPVRLVFQSLEKSRRTPDPRRQA
jgi:hypothetical protein